MRKSARTVGDRLPVGERRPVVRAVDLRVHPLLEARVLVGLGVEVYYELALLERVLAEDSNPSVLDLDDVVAGPGVAPEARRRSGPGVHDKHVLEAAPDKAVVLATHPPVVQVRLRGVYPDHDCLLELDHGVPFPEEPLEVYVADVSGVVVARYHHEVLAPEAAYILGRLLVLLAITRVREVPRDHDRRGMVVIYLQDRTLQEVRDEVRASAVDVADLANGQAVICTHALLRT